MIATRSNVLSADDIELSPLPSMRNMTASSSGGNSEDDPLRSTMQMALEYATQVEKLPVEKRYDFVKRLDIQEMRPLVIQELIRRLRRAQGRRVKHKDIAYYLDPIKDGQKDFDKVRKLMNEAEIKLTQLECNR